MGQPFIDNATGEAITPEAITAQLAKEGIGEAIESKEPEAMAPEPVEEAEAELAEEHSEETAADDAVNKSEYAALAKQYGWSEKGTKSAEEFIRHAMDNLEPRGKEIKELKMTLNELKNHMSKQQELGYQKALRELQEERLHAIQMGDVESVNELDAQIKEHENANPVPQTDPAAQAFMERHAEWLQSPSFQAAQMREFVEKRDRELSSYGLSPEAHIEQVEKDLQFAFPDYFNKADQSTEVVEKVKPVRTVESGRNQASRSKSKTFTFADLSSEQKNCARFFERQGVMKIDDYIAELVELGELK